MTSTAENHSDNSVFFGKELNRQKSDLAGELTTRELHLGKILLVTQVHQVGLQFAKIVASLDGPTVRVALGLIQKNEDWDGKQVVEVAQDISRKGTENA